MELQHARNENPVVRCSLCGLTYSAAQVVESDHEGLGCAGCAGCPAVKCPNCGMPYYDAEPRIVGFFKEVARKLSGSHKNGRRNGAFEVKCHGDKESLSTRRRAILGILVKDIVGNGMHRDEHFMEAIEGNVSEFDLAKICTALGHPRTCVRGSRIPEGECCRRGLALDNAAIMPMNKLGIGTSGKVILINNGNRTRFEYLSGYGIIPGSLISIEQTEPAYVARSGETLVALDPDVAGDIFMLL
ncbi:MAG: ferrous iron transport protein A [Deltaproteobacteria bacterium]|nr:ferrous iron transport protein A [Deltaproteobacteria bacterium]